MGFGIMYYNLELHILHILTLHSAGACAAVKTAKLTLLTNVSDPTCKWNSDILSFMSLNADSTLHGRYHG